jgi:hypothetical protein
MNFALGLTVVKRANDFNTYLDAWKSDFEDPEVLAAAHKVSVVEIPGSENTGTAETGSLTDLAAAVEASGQPLVELIRRGLMAGTAEVAQQPAPVPALSPLAPSLPASRAPESCAWDRGAGSATRGRAASVSSRSAQPALPPSRGRCTSALVPSGPGPSSAPQPDLAPGGAL